MSWIRADLRLPERLGLMNIPRRYHQKITYLVGHYEPHIISAGLERLILAERPELAGLQILSINFAEELGCWRVLCSHHSFQLTEEGSIPYPVPFTNEGCGEIIDDITRKRETVRQSIQDHIDQLWDQPEGTGPSLNQQAILLQQQGGPGFQLPDTISKEPPLHTDSRLTKVLEELQDKPNWDAIKEKILADRKFLSLLEAKGKIRLDPPPRSQLTPHHPKINPPSIHSTPSQ